MNQEEIQKAIDELRAALPDIKDQEQAKRIREWIVELMAEKVLEKAGSG